MLKIYCEAGDNTAGNKNKCNSDQQMFFLNKHLLKHILSLSLIRIILMFFFITWLYRTYFYQLWSWKYNLKAQVSFYILLYENMHVIVHESEFGFHCLKYF